MKNIYVIIATAYKRTNLLVSRAVASLYKQKDINPNCVKLIIVDDNVKNEKAVSDEFKIIKQQIELLRKKLNLKKSDYETYVLTNNRIQHQSGTGAWNTGISFAENLGSDSNTYIAVLDDDDEYKDTYIINCLSKLKSNTVAVFTWLAWITNDECLVHKFKKNQITQENFFIGNPGIQGSNLFIRMDIMIKIGGFNESLPSSTDRDLMIRFLDFIDSENIKNRNLKIEIVPKWLVNHYNHSNEKVNRDNNLKKIALNKFYSMYRQRFSNIAFQKSLERAKRHFDYSYKGKPLKIVIGMAVRNSQNTIRDSVLSILNQKNVSSEIILLIVNDNSNDGWKEQIKDYINDPRIIVKDVNYKKTYKVRNFILDFVQNNIPDVSYIGRLDSDDILVDEYVICEIEKILQSATADIILMGNRLKQNDVILDRINYVDKQLRNPEFLLYKLKQMKDGIPEGELPSCNTFVKPHLRLRYPEKVSAEDHWYTVELLKNDNLDILFAENVLYSIYSLDGKSTKQNRIANKHKLSREELYDHYRNYLKEQIK